MAQTIKEYIISYELNYWQNRLSKLKEISAPSIITQNIQEEIDKLNSGILTLKTGKKLSESPAINPSIKKAENGYVLIVFDSGTIFNIEYCRKNFNRYVRK